MRALRSMLHRVRGFFRAARIEREIVDELHGHLEELIERNVAAGMPPEEARRAAARSFGGIEQIKERARDERRSAWLEQVWRDLLYALRQSGRHRVFTAIVTLTLALGIGATAATYGVLNVHLLNPVPGAAGRRLVEINEIDLRSSRIGGVSAFLTQRMEEQSDLFPRIASAEWDYLQMAGEDFFEHVRGSRVSSELFEFFGTRPFLGRWLTPEEQAGGAVDRIVISHAWWQSRFGADRDIVGRTIKVRDHLSRDTLYLIIGVMPPEFQFPARGLSYWRLLQFRPEELERPMLRNSMLFARLAADATLPQAQARLDALTQSLALEFESQAETSRFAIRARPLRDFFVAPSVHKTLWSAAAAVVVVLLIICANITHLQIARGEARSREIAVRTALGASRAKIVRQLLIENILLAVLGAAGGIVLAFWLRQLGDALVPEFAPVLRPTGLDIHLLCSMLAVALVCGVGIGIVPAWRATETRLDLVLKTSTPHASAGRAQGRFREVLVIAQVTLALVLLTGAGLLVRSIVHVLRVDPGLNPKGLAVVNPGALLNYYRTDEQRTAVRRALIEGLSALPGTTSVGVVLNGGSTAHYVNGRANPVPLSYSWVTTGQHDYLRAIGARLVAGRWLEPSDAQVGQHAVIITETLAQTCWPGESPLGQRIYPIPSARRASQPEAYYEVVGVVRDIRDWSLEHPRGMCIVPAGQRRTTEVGHAYYVRTALDPASFALAVRRVCKETLAVSTSPEITWIEQQLYASTGTRRILTGMLTALAAVGVFLSMLGVFGLLWHAVLRRTKEIGIRIALGAQPADVLVMVLAQGMRLVAVGVLFGGGAAWVAAYLMHGLVFGISATDPVVLLSIPLLLFAVAMLACWLPARRAATIDPLVALRVE